MHAVLLCSLMLGVDEVAAAAPPPPPYQLVVCLRIANHPLLTPVFVEAVRKEVRDQSRLLLGPLATVDVVTSGHPLIDDAIGQDVRFPEIGSEQWNSAKTSERVFLVTLDYRENLYRLAWRQIDFGLRYEHPPRYRETPDRQWVARAICLAIKHDFAVIAIVEPQENPLQAVLTCRGAEHAAWLGRLLGDRGVWRLFEVVKRRGGVTERVPVPNTVLVWERKPGAILAAVHSNAKEPFKKRSQSKPDRRLGIAQSTSMTADLES